MYIYKRKADVEAHGAARLALNSPDASQREKTKAARTIDAIEAEWEERREAARTARKPKGHSDREAAELLAELEKESAQPVPEPQKPRPAGLLSRIKAAFKPADAPEAILEPATAILEQSRDLPEAVEPPTAPEPAADPAVPAVSPYVQRECKDQPCDRPCIRDSNRCVHHSKHPRRHDPNEGRPQGGWPRPAHERFTAKDGDSFTVGGTDLSGYGMAVESGTWTPSDGYVSTDQQAERDTAAQEAQQAEAARTYEMLGQSYRSRR